MNNRLRRWNQTTEAAIAEAAIAQEWGGSSAMRFMGRSARRAIISVNRLEVDCGEAAVFDRGEQIGQMSNMLRETAQKHPLLPEIRFRTCLMEFETRMALS